jgi:hypothetical protein
MARSAIRGGGSWKHLSLLEAGWVLHQVRGETVPGTISIAASARSWTGWLCPVMVEGSFGRHWPFGFWFHDVRALRT